jgi:N-acyl amino acid synthase of PEP-CTERM/exosortase system
MQHLCANRWVREARIESRPSISDKAANSPASISVKELAGEAVSESFAVRYRVYCRERRFLDEERYSEGVETDEFDWCSRHLGVFDADNIMVGTVRLVPYNAGGLPMDGHCRYEAPATSAYGEVSRLAVPRRHASSRQGGAHSLGAISIQLYRGLYQLARSEGMTHLVSAMEPSLERLVRRMHFPFEPIGPLVDYYGWVRPYVLDLDELDRKLSRNAPGIYDLFHTPLEPRAVTPGRNIRRATPLHCTGVAA